MNYDQELECLDNSQFQGRHKSSGHPPDKIRLFEMKIDHLGQLETAYADPCSSI